MFTIEDAMDASVATLTFYKDGVRTGTFHYDYREDVGAEWTNKKFTIIMAKGKVTIEYTDVKIKILRR